MTVSDHSINDSDIAIIGMAGRFPGANSIEEFWQNLKNGRDTVTFFSDEELENSGVRQESIKNPNYVKANQILSEVEMFDADFFSIPRKEAEIIDPQQRLFLECAYEAIENAGYNPENYEGLIGVYVGVGMNTYILHNLHQRYKEASSVDHYQLMLANDKDFLSTRISYKLNLKGPSININTACSTSLVSVHMACLSLLNGECDLALAGCASIRVPQVAGYLYQEGMIFSPDGHCRAFDTDAQGTILGDGIGIVALKRLSEAFTQRDTISAVIKGSAINNDGSLKTGYTAPSVEGQESVISEALAISGVDVETVTYIEAHGTGTILGDPIELAALTQAFRKQTQKKHYCAIGSVKTNIGHLDSASGMAGLIKTVMMLKNKTLVPTLHYKTSNPEIDFENSPFYVNTQVSGWKTNGVPRRAGVSSFGIGGTNSHVVLEEASFKESSRQSRRAELIILSSKTRSALDKATYNLGKHLKQNPELNLSDVAYTLSIGRKPYNHRRILIFGDTNDAALTLALSDEERMSTNYTEHDKVPVAFIFSDQLEQGLSLGNGLYEEEIEFRKFVDQSSGILASTVGLDTRKVLSSQDAYSVISKRDGDAQSILFVVTYALSKLWISWGVSPTSIVGHGIGEYVAACLAGVFSIEEALSLVAARCQIINQVPEIAELHADSAELRPFDEKIQQIQLNAPQITYFSNVTGTWITKEDAMDPTYWSKQLLCEADHCKGSIQKLLSPSEQILLEVSPSRTLTRSMKQDQSNSSGQLLLTSFPTRQEAKSDTDFITNTVGSLWLAGVDINWAGFYSNRPLQRIPLPTYPFERKRYWADVDEKEQTIEASASCGLLEQLKTASTASRRTILSGFIQEKIAAILGMEEAQLPDPERSILELNLDSVILLEIITHLGLELKRSIPLSALIEYPTIASFSESVIVSLGLASDETPQESDDAPQEKNGVHDRQNRRTSMAQRRKRRQSLRE